MSIDIHIEGTLEFESETLLQEALKEAAALLQKYEDWNEAACLTLKDLKRDGLELEIEVESSGPASCTFGTEAVIQALADFATRGCVDLDFDQEQWRITAKRKPPAAGAKTNA